MKKNVWIVAGESSGDLYGARLACDLQRLAQEHGVELTLGGMGGEKMRQAGVKTLIDSTELGVMGIFEALKLIFTFVRIFFRMLKAAEAERPDSVILIDYPGFNLRFAKALHKRGIKVIWYISPQVWVWGKKRKPVLAEVCRKMLVIFPFEKEVYADTGLDTSFVGHPLVDIVAERRIPGLERDERSFLLLPGSRTQEVERLLIPMLKMITKLNHKYPGLCFHLAAPREKIAALCRTYYEKFCRNHHDVPPVEISVGDTGYWLQKSGTGLAASGTVTVEAAIAGLPLAVGYKMNWFTLFLGIFLVKLYRGFFVMPNIIANHVVYREYLQYHFCPHEVVPELLDILPGGKRRNDVERGMAEVRELLTADKNGSASFCAAQCCWQVFAPECNGIPVASPLPVADFTAAELEEVPLKKGQQ